MHTDDASDARMVRNYVLVVVCEVVTVTALWWFGRFFSSP
jgi:hypothetical protein